MKLSEMSTKQLAAATCQLVSPIGRIAADKNLNGVFENVAAMAKENERMTMMEKMGMLLGVVPILLETHYADTIQIISVMTDHTCAEVEELNGMKMIEELRESIDSQFLSFFRSSAAMVKTTMVKGE